MTQDALDTIIRSQLPGVLTSTAYEFAGRQISGKVRDSYVDGDIRYLVTTDRLSCFDVVVTSIPFKGQVLNQMATEWFARVGDIVHHHLLDVPDPNVMVVQNCEVLPIEVVVRGYVTGSAWRDYTAGKRISGIQLPEGLRASEQLAEPIITPSTKAEVGDHDEPVSEEEILKRGLVDPKHWDYIKEASFALFQRGQEYAATQGLLLVDTKYEFGLHQGKVVLLDEIHTLDSSRYWIADSYQECFEEGRTPQMLDKEPVRRWLMEQGFSGEGVVPAFSDAYRCELSRHYVDSYQKILGTPFTPIHGDTEGRIASALQHYKQQKEQGE